MSCIIGLRDAIDSFDIISEKVRIIPMYSYSGIVDFLCIMTETTVELAFGVKAGIVWEALNKNGPSSIDNIVKATSLRRELVYGALGWLARENKIVVERRGRAMVFSLNP